ncbi:MAG: hypothetical protein CMM52_08110 [Rhodospirillaceae bacterium]|nr:hypothetical protein [Rhodospirillaceae bacterium]
MSGLSEQQDQLAQFQALFPSYSQAHGIFEITGVDAQTGKIQGNARTIRRGATVQAWEEHLAGRSTGLGSIPLLDDGESVKWAAIDIDVNDIDHAFLEKKVEDLGLPLIVCRSKSGGAHCYLFLHKRCLAKEVVDALRNWSAALGHPGVEIFPKQTERELDTQAGNPRPGNWINLPYFEADSTERYCIYRGGRLSLSEFIQLAERSRADHSALNIRHITAISEEPDRSLKSREGRNGFLFSKGCALRAEGADGEAIRAEIEALNLTATVEDHPNFADGPLPANELSQVVASVLKFEATDPRKEEQELLTRMNQKHAVVMVGGKCVIANEEFDPSWGYDTVTFSSEADLIRRYANRRVGHGKSQTTEGRAWLANPGRRQFDGVVFAPGKDTPGYLNLDRGFAVEPRHGDCSLFLDHVRNNICRCDEDLSDYLLAWMADCVQNRSRRPGISVVLRGRQGTGKGVLCSQFGALFGRHFIQVTQAGHLTGNFNSHLKDKLLVHADEAFWAGDKKAEGVLKALITEDTIQIEMKGQDVVPFRNHIRLIVSSNNEWVVPAGNEERRFFILDVSEARMQDRAYFGSIVAQMNSGGREALLQYLLDYDLSATDVGSPPKTNALMDQKAYTASPLQSWWYERLVDGHITSERTKWDTEIPTDTLHEDYITFCQNQGIKRPKAPSAFGKELKALVPELERARPSNKKSRKYVYRLGELDVCRRNFDRLTMSSHHWDEADH